jgi:hypothetical protein
MNPYVVNPGFVAPGTVQKTQTTTTVVPPPPPHEMVETDQVTKRQKKGVGFEINFLGFDFGTGFNRGTKTTHEKHRWFK